MLGVDFEPSEETRAALAQIEELARRSAKQLEKAVHLNAKQVQTAQTLPLFAAFQVWVSSLVGDVLRHLAEEQTETASALLSEDAEGLLTALEEIDKFLLDVGDRLAAQAEVDLVATQGLVSARERLAEVAEAIQELTIEEEEEGEEDGEDLEFVEDQPQGETVEVE